MTDKTQPTAHAEIAAPISADLRRMDSGAQPETLAAAARRLANVADQVRALEPEGGESDVYLAEASKVLRECAGRIAELEALQAAPPAPAAVAVPESREAEIRDVCSLIGHFGLLIQQGEASGALEQLDLIKTRLRAALAAAPAQPDLRKHLRWALHLLRNDEGGCCGQRHSEAVHALERADAVAAWSQESAARAQAVAVPADAQAPEQWIDDPHDIEQGCMLNPEWVRAQEHATQVAGQGLAIMGKSHISPAAPARAHEDARDTKIASLTKAYTELSNIFHDQVVAQQAAWIEWQHGGGAEVAMGWIENGLCGPGHIPDEGAPYGKEAQAWYDANNSDPFPACQCGRPSNIMWMGMGFCCKAHHDAARAAQGSDKP